jgi:hypothetical protein
LRGLDPQNVNGIQGFVLDYLIGLNQIVYAPAQFKSKGAPFSAKRNSLLFHYSSCFRFQRNQLLDEFSKLVTIDSLGACKTNKISTTYSLIVQSSLAQVRLCGFKVNASIASSTTTSFTLQLKILKNLIM